MSLQGRADALYRCLNGGRVIASQKSNEERRRYELMHANEAPRGRVKGASEAARIQRMLAEEKRRRLGAPVVEKQSSRETWRAQYNASVCVGRIFVKMKKRDKQTGRMTEEARRTMTHVRAAVNIPPLLGTAEQREEYIGEIEHAFIDEYSEMSVEDIRRDFALALENWGDD